MRVLGLFCVGLAHCPCLGHCLIQTPAFDGTIKASPSLAQAHGSQVRPDLAVALAMLILRSMTHKSSFYVVVVTMLFAAVAAKLKAAYDRHVPVGYEDEEGFHLGNEKQS